MSTKAILYLIITCFFLLKSLKKPELGLAYFAVIFFVRPETVSYGQLDVLHIPLLTALFVVVGWWLEREQYEEYIKCPQVFLLGLFCFFAYLCTYFSEVIALWRWPMEYLNILMYCILLTRIVVTKNSLGIFVLAITIGSVFLSIWGVDQYVKGNYRLEGLGGTRFGSNEIGAILASTLPFFIFKLNGTILYFKEPFRRNLERFAFIILSPLVVATIVFTQSRGAFLGLVASVGLLYLRSQRKICYFVILALCLFVAVPFLPENYKNRIQTISDAFFTHTGSVSSEESGGDGAIIGRLDFWGYAVQMTKEHPFLGVGLQNFELLTRQYSYGKYGIKDTHNTYLKIGAEMGVLALSIFLALIFLSLNNTRRSIKESEDQTVVGYAKAIEAALVSLVVSGLTSSYNYTEPLYWYIFMSASVWHLSKNYKSI